MVPIEVFENFSKANTSIEDRIISKKDFFEKYFFPQINDGYWQKDGMTEKRDKLVLIALDDEDLHYLIETTSCRKKVFLIELLIKVFIRQSFL
jgi:hypothetical protein